MSATAVAVDVAEQKPHVLGRYTLLDRIGEGGMAEIFRAIQILGQEGLGVGKACRPAAEALRERLANVMEQGG